MNIKNALALAKAGYKADQINALETISDTDFDTLANAGFTAQQILTMAATAQIEAGPAAPAQPATAPEPAPNPDPTPTEPASNPTPAPDALSDIMGALNKRLDDFVNTFRGQLNPSISDIKPLGVEDVIAKILKED